MRTEKEQGYNLRVPLPVYDRLRDYQKNHPHFSLNALIVEAVIKFLDSQKNIRGLEN
jgi:hypothetical protein